MHQVSSPSIFVKKRKTSYKNSNSVDADSSKKKRKLTKNKRQTTKVNHLKDDLSIRNVEGKQKTDVKDTKRDSKSISSSKQFLDGNGRSATKINKDVLNVDPTEAQLLVDLNPVSLFEKEDDKSQTDESYCRAEGTKKNPDDDGEGENFEHSEDLVGIKNTVIPKVINIKSEPADANTKNYLRRFNRRTSGIPSHF